MIGLIPAAGRATRLGALKGSKEVFPIGRQPPDARGESRPRVVCHYLLEAMRTAGITRAFIVIREGKWDVPACLGDGSSAGMHLAYLMMGLPFGAPFTLDQAYPFVKEATIALGFPDIIFEPVYAYEKVIARQAATGADVVLGLFPAAEPSTCDMVEMADATRVARIEIKPRETSLRDTWGLAVWSPAFTRFLHEYLKTRSGDTAKREFFVGDVIHSAIREGLAVEALRVSDTPYIDIGTPENLSKALRLHGGNPGEHDST